MSIRRFGSFFAGFVSLAPGWEAARISAILEISLAFFSGFGATGFFSGAFGAGFAAGLAGALAMDLG